MPWRFPAFALPVVQVNEASGDKGIDPGSRIGVQIHDEVISRTRGRGDEHNDCDKPVQEKLESVSEMECK